MAAEKKTTPQKIKPSEQHPYTCNDYRQEMILLGLQKQQLDPRLSKKEREILEEEISRLEKLIGL